mmetsp:Transcript_32116/g.102292  ORF Transcript_32116/g.102292 Transcript_32116/m.102292 type:complete len:201 (+) Transcript_32116:760-1362(+)
MRRGTRTSPHRRGSARGRVARGRPLRGPRTDRGGWRERRRLGRGSSTIIGVRTLVRRRGALCTTLGTSLARMAARPCGWPSSPSRTSTCTSGLLKSATRRGCSSSSSGSMLSTAARGRGRARCSSRAGRRSSWMSTCGSRRRRSSASCCCGTGACTRRCYTAHTSRPCCGRGRTRGGRTSSSCWPRSGCPSRSAARSSRT